MLVFFVEPDASRAWTLRAALRARGCASAFARNFEAADALLMGGARPGVVYVADSVPPLAGADLLAQLERNPSLAGVPIVIGLRERDSVLAEALARGGMRVVDPGMAVERLAALLAEQAATCSHADWRRSVLAWSQYVQRRVAQTRERLARDARARGSKVKRS